MKRSYLRVGDRSSVDGTVIEGIPKCTHHGKEITYVGARVICPACKTTGKIEAKGPRWPGTMMGKARAMEGDICVCECSPPPVMIASQDTMFESFESSHLAEMGFGSEITSDPMFATHIQRVLVQDSSTGMPLRNQRYVVHVGGEQLFGETDDSGYAVIRSSGEKEFSLHVIFSAPKRELKYSDDN